MTNVDVDFEVQGCGEAGKDGVGEGEGTSGKRVARVVPPLVSCVGRARGGAV